MDDYVLKVRSWVAKLNGWRIGFVLFTAYSAIAGYVHGLENSLKIVALFWAFYSIGYFASAKDTANKLQERSES